MVSAVGLRGKKNVQATRIQRGGKSTLMASPAALALPQLSLLLHAQGKIRNKVKSFFTPASVTLCTPEPRHRNHRSAENSPSFRHRPHTSTYTRVNYASTLSSYVCHGKAKCAGSGWWHAGLPHAGRSPRAIPLPELIREALSGWIESGSRTRRRSAPIQQSALGVSLLGFTFRSAQHLGLYPPSRLVLASYASTNNQGFRINSFSNRACGRSLRHRHSLQVFLTPPSPDHGRKGRP